MTQARTPILQRLEHLERQYAFFKADRDARLLCWAFAPDEERVFEGYLQQRIDQNTEEDFWVVSEEPFTTSLGHGLSLVRELKALTDAENDALAEADTYDIPWKPPPLPAELKPRKGRPAPDPLYLRDALLGLHEHQCTDQGCLTLCLRPEDIQDPEGYAQWLGALLALLEHPRVRVIVCCERRSPWAVPLVRANPRTARWLDADLNVPSALEEICAAAEDNQESSGRYRTSFVRAMNAISTGDLVAARQHAAIAVQIARAEGWVHLEFAAYQLLGSGALGLGQHAEAVAHFELAERVVSHDVSLGKNNLTPLLLQARLSKGSALLTLGSYARAAQVFEREALPNAHALGDTAMELESLRMASYCLERADDTSEAWKRAVAAVAVGASMAPEARAATNLALVGEALLRMLKGFGHGRQRTAIRDKFTSLLGPDWERQTVPGSASAEDMIDSPLTKTTPAWLDDADRDPVQHTLDISATRVASDLKRAAAVATSEPAPDSSAPIEHTWDASALVSDPADRTWDYPVGLPPAAPPPPGKAPSKSPSSPAAARPVSSPIAAPPPLLETPPQPEPPLERTWIIPGGPAAPSAPPGPASPPGSKPPAPSRGST